MPANVLDGSPGVRGDHLFAHCGVFAHGQATAQSVGPVGEALALFG